VDSSISPSPGTLQPRYRRVLSFGDVLDESIRVFRQNWVNFALVSAIALIPPGILLVWVTTTGVFTSLGALSAIQSGRFPNPAVFAGLGFAILASTLVSVLFGLLWSAATVVTANTYLHGEVPTLRGVYGEAARHLFGVLVATVVLLLALIVLMAVASVLFFITVGGLVGIVPVVALIAWWLRPGARKGWVKWLIIVTTPFGLAAYFSFRWSMYLVAIMLENCGPIGAFQRSSQLTDRHWFRVASILIVSGLIVAVLRSILTLLVSVPLSVSSTLRGELSPGVVESAINGAVGILVQILFASVGSVVYTLLFVDLRNRREGTDMAERLTQLEASPITPGE
jgi:hypothetical protein